MGIGKPRKRTGGDKIWKYKSSQRNIVINLRNRHRAFYNGGSAAQIYLFSIS